jgi:hypothetical protein
MIPRGPMRILSPILGMVGRKNLKDTANALKAHLEENDPPRGIAG